MKQIATRRHEGFIGTALLGGTLCLATIVGPGVAFADIVMTTGSIEILDQAPQTVMPNQFQDNNDIFVFLEKENYELTEDIEVDLSVPGTAFDPPQLASPTVIEAGTVVNSYYVHFDPVTNGHAVGSVIFGEPVLGVIGNDPLLDASNAELGVDETEYPFGGTANGLEDNPSPDKASMYDAAVSVVFNASSPGDRMRIITAATGTAVERSSADVPISGHKIRIKDKENDPSRRRLLFQSKSPAIDSATVDPRKNGAFLQVWSGTDSICVSLAADGWTPSASLPPVYKYKDLNALSAPCRTATIKRGKLQVNCSGLLGALDFSLDEASQGEISVTLTTGTTRYCTHFDSNSILMDSGVDERGLYLAKDTPAPSECPEPPTTCP